MESLIGTSIPAFVALTVVIMGGAAYLTGQAVAATWRPYWQALAYGLLLGLTDRFLTFALFEGELLSLSGFVVDTALLTTIALFAFRVTRVAKMVSQYPWLYRRAGLLNYHDIAPSDGD